ncbi:MAG: lipase maturation factor family protein [Chlamydiia bacterium]|nr:lipase maturation factor family protein [Chlamydiia bacterium]
MGLGEQLNGSFALSQALFLRAMGFVYAIAFVSLLIQVRGLFGSRGIQPIAELTSSVSRQFLRAPSLFWWWNSDRVLLASAALGAILGFLCLCGWMHPVFFVLMWGLYLSFYSLGSPFLGYQWDALLLEAGFITMGYSMQQPPQMLYVLLLSFLLFRLMFSSGVVKWTSRCPLWRSLRAMEVHYESQPLPNPMAWWMHKQPLWFARLSTGLVFFLELFVPFLLFLPTPAPLIAVLLLMLLQVGIMLTGNYAFFNLLTLALCIPLLSDANLFFLQGLVEPVQLQPPLMLQGLLAVLATVLLLLNALQLARLFVHLGAAGRPLQWAQPWGLCSSYGLFARMTAGRDEIVIGGSDDGKNWLDYEFFFKPGACGRVPSQVAPHQPRLDWQMWFAALGTYRYNEWYLRLLKRILEGEPTVLDLFSSVPFKGRPPRYLRSFRYRYTFSSIERLRKTGEWWDRVPKEDYAPIVTLNQDGHLQSVDFK